LTWLGSHTYKAVMPNELIEHEFDHLFIAYENPAIDCFNPEEVAALRWQTVTEIEQQLLDCPQVFTPWFLPTFEKIKQQL